MSEQYPNHMDSRFKAAGTKKWRFQTSKFTGTITQQRTLGGRGPEQYLVECTEIATGQALQPFVRMSLKSVEDTFQFQNFKVEKDYSASDASTQSNQDADDQLIRQAIDNGEKLTKTFRDRAIQLGWLKSDGTSTVVVETQIKAFEDSLSDADALSIAQSWAAQYPTFFSSAAPEMTAYNAKQVWIYVRAYHMPRTSESLEKAFRWLAANGNLHSTETFGKRRMQERIRAYVPPTPEGPESRAARIARCAQASLAELSEADQKFLRSLTDDEMKAIERARPKRGATSGERRGVYAG